MKFPAFLLGFVLVCCLGIAGYIHTRRKQELHLNKQASFIDIKFRVTRDVLGEYEDQLNLSNTEVEKTKKEVDALTKDVSQVKTLVAQKKSDVDICKGDKKRLTDETAASASEKKQIQDEFAKEKSHWVTEDASLKKQLEEESALCKYIDKTSDEGKKLCNIIEEPKKPEVKEPVAEPAAVKPVAEEKKVEKPEAEQPKVKAE